MFNLLQKSTFSGCVDDVHNNILKVLKHSKWEEYGPSMKVGIKSTLSSMIMWTCTKGVK